MAVKAQINQPSSDGGEREIRRLSLRLETNSLLPEGRQGNVTIHNLSSAGLLIETDVELADGEILSIELPEAGAVEARVAWSSGRLHGCAFVETLGKGAIAAALLQGLPVAQDKESSWMEDRATPLIGDGCEIGRRLNRARRDAGLTLDDVATRLGVSKPTVWAWEKGKAKPRPERIAAIANALGLLPTELSVTVRTPEEVEVLVEDCRSRIADAYNIRLAAVRIMIEM
jgi:transcriptional regulator with XRE-family HTH domain